MRNLRTRASKPLAHKYILKYININIYIIIREGMREARERREKVVGRGERERERKYGIFRKELGIKRGGVWL